LSDSFHEAASVCLARHHNTPANINVSSGSKNSKHQVWFLTPDQRMLNAWANDIDTTEFGAYGVALAAVETTEGLVAMRRAETLTGADWYVVPIGEAVEDLEACHRLEVSGVNAGGLTDVEARLRQKLEQTRRGRSNLPAIAAVVGFKEKLVLIRRVEAER
jgi:hypothetical protein